jgi:hypothetical protein
MRRPDEAAQMFLKYEQSEYSPNTAALCTTSDVYYLSIAPASSISMCSPGCCRFRFEKVIFLIMPYRIYALITHQYPSGLIFCQRQ